MGAIGESPVFAGYIADISTGTCLVCGRRADERHEDACGLGVLRTMLR